MSKRLSELVELGAERHGDATVTSLVADSRACTEGSLFVCMPSNSSDTYSFLDDAKARGATATVVFDEIGKKRAKALDLAIVLISGGQPDYNIGVAKIAKRFYDDPSAKMRVVAITGTNGKTTTAWMMRDALVALGRRAAYMGTLGFDPDGSRRELANTTPFPVEVWSQLNEAREKGVQDFVMEASSHALHERRLSSVRFDVGVFTNLSQDHLDFHGDMRHYAASKLLLFTEYASGSGAQFRSAINIGDPIGKDFADQVGADVSFGSPQADLVCESIAMSANSMELLARFGGGEQQISLGVGGLFNVWNATSALAGLLALGCPFQDAARAMQSVRPVPGRFEAVPTERGFSIIVDYAHTDDALSKLLRSVRELNPRRIVTVFGCGGDRDKSKRPKMARAASAASDVTIVTSDNPRTEDPEQIIRDVLTGLEPGKQCETIIDRRAAIRRAVEIASDGDVVVIAGKGHEDYQIIGRTKHHMDDRELAREALSCLK